MRKVDGGIDVADFHQITGWVLTTQDPNDRVQLEVVDHEGAVLVRTVADQFRKDLKEAGVGDGYHGFLIRFNDSVFPFAWQRIRVRSVGDGVDIPGSPVVLRREMADFDSGASDWLKLAIASQSASAQSSDDLDATLEFLLECIGDVVSAQDDLRAPGAQPHSDFWGSARGGKFGEMVDLLRTSFQPLDMDEASDPVVSIIIPVINLIIPTPV